jgi:hypothetical protein
MEHNQLFDVKDIPNKKKSKLVQIKKTGEQVDLFDYSYVRASSLNYTEEELDVLFPKRIPVGEDGNKFIDDMDQQEWEDICAKDGKCCVGYGESRSNKAKCNFCFDSGGKCAIYDRRPEHMLCPDIKYFMKSGIFPYVAHRGCNYWKVYESLTGLEFLNKW